MLDVDLSLTHMLHMQYLLLIYSINRFNKKKKKNNNTVHDVFNFSIAVCAVNVQEISFPYSLRVCTFYSLRGDPSWSLFIVRYNAVYYLKTNTQLVCENTGE